MRWLGALLLIAAGGGAGLYQAAALRRREQVLSAVLRFVNWLIMRLRYTAAPLSLLLQEAATHKEFSPLVFSRSPEPEAFSQSFRRAIESAPCRLSDEDAALLLRFGEEMGKTDLAGQLDHAAQYAALFEEQRRKAAANFAQKGRVYAGVWLSGAAVLALLLV